MAKTTSKKTLLENLQEVLQSVQDTLDENLNTLHDEADVVASEFWSWVLQNNANQDKAEKNNLGLRVRRTATGVSIQWYYNTWYKDKQGRWKPNSHYIRKGRRTTSYPKSTLLKHAQSWQEDKVWETEERLAEIRTQVQRITDLRKATGMMRKRYEEAGDIL